MFVTALEASPAPPRFDDICDPIASPADPAPLVRLNRVPPDGFLHLLEGLRQRAGLAGKRIVQPVSGNP